ncbi:MAG TPA: hypothetical protein VFN87_08015 [Solirubrobacteraceae bacterium]|nr:hypothetical protein [Solirubrobacteraceae bacterium]
MPSRSRLPFALWTSVLVLSGGITLTAAGGAGARVADVSGVTPTITEYPLPAADLGPLHLASTRGELVFTETGAAALGVRAADGTIAQQSGLSQPATGITAGPAGDLWFTEAAGTGAIGRITPTGTITQYTTGLTPNSAPTDITTGPDGNLWFTERADSGRLGTVRLSPAEHGGPGAAPAGPLGAVTEAPRRIGTRTATVAAVVTASDANATYHFEWGTTPDYGHRVPGADASIGSGTGRHVLVKTLTGLTPGTVYHYRVVATDCGGCQTGTSAGSDMTFETLSSGAPGDLAAQGLRPPAIGRTALVGLASGTVLVRRPGASRSVPLTRNTDIPTGSVIDAGHGSVVITTSLGAHRRMQSAAVWGGAFVVHQSRTRGMTTFTLAGPLACTSHAHAVRAMAMATMVRFRRRPRRRPRHRVRSLWARDNHGQYSTRGQNSVTTVRGTWWETVDTCAGTRTFVKRGVVAVRDLHRKRTVIVRAGHSYLARR